jgi:hypothetical protein
MIRVASRRAAPILAVGMIAGLVGCKCGCPENKQAGIPRILCQPADQFVLSNQDAVFSVKAKGDNLSYRWLFQDTNGISLVPNGSGPELVVPASNPVRFGSYSCVIDSTGAWGQSEIQTRTAILPDPPPPFSNFSQSPLAANTSTNGVSTVVMYYSPGGANICCTNCGWGNLQNSGAGWTLGAGQTFTFEVSTDANGMNILNTALYCVIWHSSTKPPQLGCCTDFSPTLKQFTPPVGATYVFTVYLKGSCPATGTHYYVPWSY